MDKKLVIILFCSLVLISGCGQRLLPSLTSEDIELMEADWYSAGCSMRHEDCGIYMQDLEGKTSCWRIKAMIDIPSEVMNEVNANTAMVGCKFYIDGKPEKGIYEDSYHGYYDGYQNLEAPVNLELNKDHTIQICCRGEWEEYTNNKLTACQSISLEKFCD